ncbi:MAG: hypothetical protein RIQ89_831 [Bacteroidota bacterium]|jgi:myo-inositol-1(or 4)-monophosphatase
MQKDRLAAITQQAISATHQTAAFIANERKHFKLSAIERKGHNDLVSYVDKNAEKQLIAALQKIVPESTFLAEESSNNGKTSECYWIIDPLDGTTNFIHGLPCYCISIALVVKNKIMVGVIHEINLNETFSAFLGGGAFLNGEKISVSPITLLSDALIATGFPYSNYSRLAPYMEVFNHCMFHTHGLRRLGSAAADLAYVAAGRLESFFEYGLQPWDVAAGILLVQEAGGMVSDFNGGNNYLYGKEIIASNNHIAPQMLSLVKEKFSTH